MKDSLGGSTCPKRTVFGKVIDEFMMRLFIFIIFLFLGGSFECLWFLHNSHDLKVGGSHPIHLLPLNPREET